MTKNISITIEEDLLNYLDDLAEINGRSRSSMLSWLIKKSYDEDKALDLIHDIAVMCKESKYPEDLEDIYDLLTNNGIDFKNLEDNTRWLN